MRHSITWKRHGNAIWESHGSPVRATLTPHYIFVPRISPGGRGCGYGCGYGLNSSICLAVFSSWAKVCTALSFCLRLLSCLSNTTSYISYMKRLGYSQRGHNFKLNNDSKSRLFPPWAQVQLEECLESLDYPLLWYWVER